MDPKVIRYKTLREDGRSINMYGYGSVQYPLPQNGQPGAWIEVPGNGAYTVNLGGPLFAGGAGDILAELECEKPSNALAIVPEVFCYKRVRVLRVVPWLEIPPEQGEWRCKAAVDVRGLSNEERRELVMGTAPDQVVWRQRVAEYEIEASRAAKTVSGIPLLHGLLNPVFLSEEDCDKLLEYWGDKVYYSWRYKEEWQRMHRTPSLYRIPGPL